MKVSFVGNGTRWEICKNVSLPAETSTTAMKRAISSGSRPMDPSFSLKSNMASSREPIPRALSDASEYVCPLRKVTARSLASNSEQNLTIRTCGRSGDRSTSDRLRTDEKVQPIQRYLEGARFEQHDLVVLAETLEAWDALCKFHNFSDRRGEALGERVPHLLAGSAGRGNWTSVERARLQERGNVKKWWTFFDRQ